MPVPIEAVTVGSSFNFPGGERRVLQLANFYQDGTQLFDVIWGYVDGKIREGALGGCMRVDAFAEAATAADATDVGPKMDAEEGAQRLRSRDTIEHLLAPVDVTLRTSTPQKWLFFDLVNGEGWVHNANGFRPARLDELHDLACEAALSARMLKDKQAKAG
ncbi:hypothetical protein HNP46_006763 [Pseudomonas nitritireducens]|uniref:Uncharacterized protein n=1 Tax=Pseudomonas nitroreducens TaxID=46680 RepID=A0A7W7P5D6_PSENT|nr:hypothetical protein [Pseudomonas nitritireducens]MBB4867844.1 hypothetical protein [Pseudomonas nitritireducens]